MRVVQSCSGFAFQCVELCLVASCLLPECWCPGCASSDTTSELADGHFTRALSYTRRMGCVHHPASCAAGGGSASHLVSRHCPRQLRGDECHKAFKARQARVQHVQGLVVVRPQGCPVCGALLHNALCQQHEL